MVYVGTQRTKIYKMDDGIIVDKQQWWRGAPGALDTSRGASRAQLERQVTLPTGEGAGGDGGNIDSVKRENAEEAAVDNEGVVAEGDEDATGRRPLPSGLQTRQKPEMSPVEAVLHGLDYLYVTSCDPNFFASFGTEIMHCFNDVVPTATEPVRGHCLALLKNTAYRWRSKNTDVPKVLDGSSAEQMMYHVNLFDQLEGIYSLERAGLAHELKMKIFDEIRQLKIGAKVLFDLDPSLLNEGHFLAPDTPDTGGESLKCIENQITNLSHALTHMFHADALTLPLNESPSDDVSNTPGKAPNILTYAKVLQWVDLVHPYFSSCQSSVFGSDSTVFPHLQKDIYKACRKLSQALVLTLSNFGEFRLLPALLPSEYELLCSRRGIQYALDTEDADEISFTLLCLRIFGHSEKDEAESDTGGKGDCVTRAPVSNLVEWLVKHQQAKGYWKPNPDMSKDDVTGIHDYVHSTCQVCMSLLPPRFRGFGPAPSACREVLEQWRINAQKRQLEPKKEPCSGNDENSTELFDSKTCAGTAVGTVDDLAHVYMMYDRNLAAKHWLENQRLVAGCKIRYQAFLSYFSKNEMMEEHQASASESESDTEGSSHSRKKKMGSAIGLSNRGTKRLLESNDRVKALRKVARGLKSEHHFGQRLMSYMKRLDGEKYPQRDTLINAVDYDYNVRVGGVAVSLLNLFQRAAKHGGMQIKQPESVWAQIARECEIPQNVHRAGSQVKRLYQQYMRKWANEMVETKLNHGVTKASAQKKKRAKHSVETEL